MRGGKAPGLISDEALQAIKGDLAELQKARTKKDDQARALSVMASLFYEIDALLDAGGTHDDVLSVLSKHGVVVGRTRFGQNLFRLRQLFPKREREIQIDATLVNGISCDLNNFISDARKNVGGRPGKQKSIPTGKRILAKSVPLREKVLACTSMILDVAEKGAPAVDAASAALRAELGPGWTFRVAVQFAIGTRFAEWVQADWQDEEDAKRVEAAQAVALHVAGLLKTQDKAASIKAAVRFYKRFSR